MVQQLIVNKTRTREEAEGNQVSEEFYEELDEKVRELIADAQERAEANRRTTLKARDV